METAEGMPDKARPAPIKDAVIGIAKNSASVDLPYTFTDAEGAVQAGMHTFWFKRVARTWVVSGMQDGHTGE